MTDLETARFVHGLAVLIDDFVLCSEGWPRIVLAVGDLSRQWPAAVDLSGMTGAEESEIHAKVLELAEQLDVFLGDHPRLDPWDAVAGLLGRAWRMGLLDTFDAMVYLHNLWGPNTIPNESGRSGAWLIWAAEGVWEYDGFIADGTTHIVERDGTPILIDSDALLSQDAVSRPLCIAVLEALNAMWPYRPAGSYERMP